jgi:hypothetical protein
MWGHTGKSEVQGQARSVHLGFTSRGYGGVTAGCSKLQRQAKSVDKGFTARGYVGVTAGGSKRQGRAENGHTGHTSQGYEGILHAVPIPGTSEKRTRGVHVTRLMWMWGCYRWFPISRTSEKQAAGIYIMRKRLLVPGERTGADPCHPCPPSCITWVPVPSHGSPFPHMSLFLPPVTPVLD